MGIITMNLVSSRMSASREDSGKFGFFGGIWPRLLRSGSDIAMNTHNLDSSYRRDSSRRKNC